MSTVLDDRIGMQCILPPAMRYHRARFRAQHAPSSVEGGRGRVSQSPGCPRSVRSHIKSLIIRHVTVLFVLLGLAVMPAAASSFIDWPWSMIGVFLTGMTWPITLAVIIYYNRRPERRRRQLIKHPASAFFIIPSVELHDCSYA